MKKLQKNTRNSSKGRIKMKNKLIFLILGCLLFSGITLGNTKNNKGQETLVVGQEVKGINLQQLDYRKIKNTNETLKNQRIESTNMEIVGDSIKRERQRIKVVQSDELEIREEIEKGKRSWFN